MTRCAGMDEYSQCPLADRCARFTREPTGWDSWAYFIAGLPLCIHYWPMEGVTDAP